jgi:ribosomal protein S18 acetylase RimI-like enzyme
MPFDLTAALIGNILFAMENQEGEFFLDTQTGDLAGGPEEILEAETTRYIPLPGWESSDGFRLMERFAASLRNPLVREELSAALDRGRGVFRAFKDILGRYPETEKLWFAFKEREMKRKIIRWYNVLREEWGLERIGEEPEETGDLVYEDFCFHESRPEDRPAAAALHALCLAEHTAQLPGEENLWAFPGDLSFTAKTLGEEFAGYIAAINRGTVLDIRALEIKPEYRGLGIGEALLSRLLDAAGAAQQERAIRHLSIDLPVAAEGFSRVLLRESFQPAVIRYCRVLNGNEEASVPPY